MFCIPSFSGFKIPSGGGGIPTFEFTINTSNTSTGSSNSDQFKLPLITSTGLNCTVDWGDGNTDTITNHLAAAVTHTYASSGTYTVKITGDLLGWKFNNTGDRLKILDVKKWSGLKISVNEGFFGCANLTASATDAPTITTNSFAEFFRNCTNFNGKIGNWDVSTVTLMNNTFLGATAFNQNIGDWDVSNVTVFSNFLFGKTPSTFSSANLDAIYIGWSSRSVKPNVGITFGTAKYSTAAVAGRAILTGAPNNWTITDGGLI